MKRNNYYKVTLLSPSLELEKYSRSYNIKEYNKGTNIIEILRKCAKEEIMTVIVYKTLRGKYKEIITKKEIPCLFFESWEGYYMTKKFPLFFEAKENDYDDCKFELLENLRATPKEVSVYLQDNLKKVSENSNYYKDSKKIYSDKLDSLFTNAMNEYLNLIEYLNVYDSSLRKTNERQIKQLKKKYKF